jgi:hypothetical protein
VRCPGVVPGWLDDVAAGCGRETGVERTGRIKKASKSGAVGCFFMGNARFPPA